jgi:hypothetical protein
LGVVAGYDLLDTITARLIHRLDGSAHRLFDASALTLELGRLPHVTATSKVAFGGLVARFCIEKGSPDAAQRRRDT